jgi:hypothetical protein
VYLTSCSGNLDNHQQAMQMCHTYAAAWQVPARMTALL